MFEKTMNLPPAMHCLSHPKDLNTFEFISCMLLAFFAYILSMKGP